MKALFRFLIIMMGLVVIFSCKDEAPTNTNKNKVVPKFTKEGILSLRTASSDSIIKILDIEIADNEYETQTGLMYRTSLATNQGMLFVFPDEQMRSFYMKNTKLPLDIIYINAAKEIVSIQKDAKPFDETSLPSEAPAKYVLEVYAGLTEEWQLKKGDKIVYDVL